MFRMLLRSEQQVEAFADEDASNLTDEVHANIIAGPSLDDGQTIVARLPMRRLSSDLQSAANLFRPKSSFEPHCVNKD
jgi:hypothetical protein